MYNVRGAIGGGAVGVTAGAKRLLISSSLELDSPVPGEEFPPKWILGNEDLDDKDRRSFRSSKSMVRPPPFVGRYRSLEFGTEVIPSSVPDSVSESSDAAVETGSSDVSTHVVKYLTMKRWESRERALTSRKIFVSLPTVLRRTFLTARKISDRVEFRSQTRHTCVYTRIDLVSGFHN